MTATLHKLSAGDGYEYYVRQVAALDVSQRGRSALADYYTARGESPGRWRGSGLVAFDDINIGDMVIESQMKALYGEGRHPNANVIEEQVRQEQIGLGANAREAARAALAATQLGNPYRAYRSGGEYRQRCGLAFAAANVGRGALRNAALPEEQRAAIRTAVAREMFVEEFSRAAIDDRELSGWVARNSRSATTAVAGFDFTFSPPKSVSALWALAPGAAATKIQSAHDAAVADAIGYLEQRHTYTRIGRNGCRQVDVEGLIGTAFTHRDSRAGDPDLHTHVVVANKVRTLDGAWHALDGRMLYQGTVTASEVYNTRLEMHLGKLVGVVFETLPNADPSKRPTREIVGVDRGLCRRWSSRRIRIEARLGELATQFQHRHGREPMPKEMLDLAQQATLETRTAKHDLRSLGEQRTSWWTEAVTALGSASGVVAMVYAACHPQSTQPEVVDSEWIARVADEVITTVSQERATWRETHVRSEVERRVRGRIPEERWTQIVPEVVRAVLSPSRSIARRIPDQIPTPDVLVRRDGTDVYLTAGSRQYTSAPILAAERRLLAAAQHSRGRAVSGSAVESAERAFAADDRHGLNAGQVALVREFATSGAGFQVATAPAGTGKTTAMRVLAAAWTADGGTVLGLAPTAAAAAVLGEDIGAATHTIDKLTHTLERVMAGDDPVVPRWIHDIGPGTLVIVDEVAKAGTLKLDLAVSWLLKRGATVRGIGDDHQLSSVAAGGIVRDIVAATNAHTLTTVVRFVDRSEGPVSLAVRAGDPAAIAFYLDNGRVHSGTPAALQDTAYAAWSRDISAGLDAVMLAPTHDIVRALNERARADRLATLIRAGGVVGREVELADGLCASVGDLIITGRNDPRLRISSTDSVRNGYRWRVTAIHSNGSIEATHLRSHRKVTLPPEYVAEHVDLGYASTISTAQGITTDTCHGVLTGHEDRALLYVMITRGRQANHVYVPTASDGTEQSPWTYQALHPATTVDRLTDIIGRDGFQRSATTSQREAFDPTRRLGATVDAYTDAIGAIAEHIAGPDTMARIDAAAHELYGGLTKQSAWPVLRGHLATIAIEGRDPVEALRTAIARRELNTADDVAAVLDWRLDRSGNHSARVGPLPWLRGVPTALTHHPEYGPYLADRTRLITVLTGRVAASARQWTPATAPGWARLLADVDTDLLADLAIWRAALHIDDADRRPTGPQRRYPIGEKRHQQHLHRRLRAALGTHPDHAVNRWAAFANQINARIVDDPYWPALADQLDLAHYAGLDVPVLVQRAADIRPLPDELPAAALRWRLVTQLDPGAPAVSDNHLRPAWTTALAGVLGHDLASHILDDPAWPQLVAAVEAANPAHWPAPKLLGSAFALICAPHDGGSDPIRPHEMATAMAWWIGAIVRHTATDDDLIAPEPPDPTADEETAARAGIPHPDEPYLPGKSERFDAEYASDSSCVRVIEPDEDYIAALVADESLSAKPGIDIAEDGYDWATAALDAARSSTRRYPNLTLAQQATRLRADINEIQHRIDDIRAAISTDDPLDHSGITDPEVLELRVRADAQRPYRLAWLDAQEQLLEAEVQAAIDRAHCQELAAELDRSDGADPILTDLEQLLAHAPDPATRAEFADDLAALRELPSDPGKRLELHLAQLAADHSTSVAAAAHSAHNTARRALLDFAGGPEQIVDETDVGLAHLNAQFRLHDDLGEARHELEYAKAEMFHVSNLQHAESADQPITDPPAEPLRQLPTTQLNNLIDSIRQRIAMAMPISLGGDADSATAQISIAMGSPADVARLQRQLNAARGEQRRRAVLTADQLAHEEKQRDPLVAPTSGVQTRTSNTPALPDAEPGQSR